MKTTRESRAIVIMTVLLLSATLAYAQGTELLVYQVQAAQLPGTALMDVWYRLYTVGGGPVTIRLFLSTDGGLSYPHLCHAVSGDVGPGVLPGTGKHIVWNAGAEFPGYNSETCKVRVTADDGVYLISELQGAWETHGIGADGPGAPWWEWAQLTIAADGTLNGTATYSTGGGGSKAGAFAMTPAGVLSIVGSSDNFQGALDADRDVMAWSSTWAGSTGSGTAELGFGVRQGGSYSMADLIGRWEDNRIASEPGAPWWMRGDLVIEADGSFTGHLSEFGDSPQTVTGTAPTISSDGVLSAWGGDLGARCVMNAGKTVMVGTATWASGTLGTAELSIDVKMAASYSVADLQGTWQFFAVSSGTGPWWQRATVAIGPAGSFSATATDIDGSTDTITGTFAITTEGIITLPGAPAFRGVLDAGKTVMVSTDTHTNGASQMMVGLRTHW